MYNCRLGGHRRKAQNVMQKSEESNKLPSDEANNKTRLSNVAVSMGARDKSCGMMVISVEIRARTALWTLTNFSSLHLL